MFEEKLKNAEVPFIFSSGIVSSHQKTSLTKQYTECGLIFKKKN